MSELYLTCIDGVTIFADWSPLPNASRVVLLLHQRSKDHAIWNDFRKALETKGWSTLAIDLRGHGKSEGFGKNKDLTFDQFDDYHSMYFDVSTAVDFIKNQLVPELARLAEASGVARVEGHAKNYKLKTINYKLALIGSSIGANLALAYAADHFEVNAAVCLSPGLNYYGLRTDDVMVEYHRPLAIVTAKDDPSYPDAQKLIKEPGVQRPNMWYQEYDAGGHGVKLLETHPELGGKIVEWLEKNI